MLSLSIIIPSYCRPDLLCRCLTSVSLHAPAAAEVIVVDDGSPSGEVRAAAQAFSEVQVVRLPRRRGFCAAANAGIRAARGAVVELLNDDTEVTADWASLALAVFEDPTVAAVAPLVLQRDEKKSQDLRIDSAGDRYYLGGVAGKRGRGQPLGPDYLNPCRVFGASASSAFYCRDILERVGGFPETFGAYFEDVDLSFRLHRAGYHVIFEPRSRVYHQVSASYGKPGRGLLEQQSLNEERVFWRNVPASMLRHALPRHLAVLAAKGWRRWQEGTLAPFLWGRLRLLAEIPALLRHRQALNALGSPEDIKTWEVEERYWGNESIEKPFRNGERGA